MSRLPPRIAVDRDASIPTISKVSGWEKDSKQKQMDLLADVHGALHLLALSVLLSPPTAVFTNAAGYQLQLG